MGWELWKVVWFTLYKLLCFLRWEDGRVKRMKEHGNGQALVPLASYA